MEYGALVLNEREECMDLPPGFRFHPTDEELITHYLSKKVIDASFIARAIGEADLNKCEPWDLPRRAKMGEKEWYFFCVRDRKYPTGLRTNRATEAGYWKATGKDKEITRGKSLVGMRKTLVFYRGRAPKGEKTNWVMHEFRLEGKYSSYNLPKTAKNEWVICRVFEKSLVGKKVVLGSELGAPASLLPPLMDVMHNTNSNRAFSPADPAHVTCFSDSATGLKGGPEELLAECFNYPFRSASAANSSRMPLHAGMQYRSLVQLLESKPEREMLSNISQETGLTTDINTDISSADAHDDPSISAGPLNLEDCLWNY